MRYPDSEYDDLPYDAVLVVSFGGPEGPDDVMPFLENVLRGKNVPRERMLEVSEHYQHFGGVSPINGQCRELIAALAAELAANGPRLPIYWGNRNWKPMLQGTLQEMADNGVRRAIAFFTSTFSCYSGCRQYREDIQQAQAAVGEAAPRIDKVRMPYNHPALIDTNADHLGRALADVPEERRSAAKVLFTAHSIPDSMAENCKYERQLTEASRLTAEAVGHANWELVYQSRSGPPQQPWLEPDVCDRIEQLHEAGELQDVVILPIGFVSDHMEVLFDLDTEAKELCEKLGVNLVRAATLGTHPRTITMIRELIEERIATERGESPERPAVGQYAANHDVCPRDCCTYVPRRPPGVGGTAPNQSGAARPGAQRPDAQRPGAGRPQAAGS
ncbi:MAG: ferrochelatase [Planctomycetota bacterium]